MNYSSHILPPGTTINNNGGQVSQINKWDQFDRFLILGSEGGSYYATEQKLTRDNAKNVEACIVEDGIRAVNRIVEISEAGRAAKNDPAIFALALAASANDMATRQAAMNSISRVCRIGTHLFHFAQNASDLRGWGKSLRRGISRWYTDKTADQIAYQAVKYQQRDGWSHKDLLRLSHPVSKSEQQEAVFRYICGISNEAREVQPGGKQKNTRNYPAVAAELPSIIEGFEICKTQTHPGTVASLIRKYSLTHEMVPTESKNDVKVWQALIENMPMTAMIRNLNKMTAVGALDGEYLNTVVNSLNDQEKIKKSRIHPISILSALRVYGSGQGVKGSLTWNPNPKISEALDNAFYLAFKNIEPTGKNIFLALDISGSMGWANTSTIPGLTARDCSAAMAMATLRSEKNCFIAGFQSSLVELKLTPKMNLNQVISTISNLRMGGTDCSAPMRFAEKNNLEMDAFFVYTDNDTGRNTNPPEALRKYRKSSGRNAKLVVVATTPTDFTIADPSDSGMLDVVGFDTETPAVMSEFIR